MALQSGGGFSRRYRPSVGRARTLLDYLLVDANQGQQDTPPNPHGVEATILSIASDLQTFWGRL